MEILNSIFNVLNNNFDLILLFVASLSAYFAYKAWKVNKVTLKIDKIKISKKFEEGIYYLKLIHSLGQKLLINNYDNFNSENLEKDIPILQQIMKIINNNRYKLLSAFIPPIELNDVEKTINEIFLISENDYVENDVLKREIIVSYSMLFLFLYLLVPEVNANEHIGIEYPPSRVIHKEFLNKHKNWFNESKN